MIVNNRTEAQARYACYKSLVDNDSFEGTFKEFLGWLGLEKCCRGTHYEFEDWYKKDIQHIKMLKSEWGF